MIAAQNGNTEIVRTLLGRGLHSFTVQLNLSHV